MVVLVGIDNRFFPVEEEKEEEEDKQQEENEIRTANIAIYSHALLKTHVIRGQRLVRIALPPLPSHHSSPATRDFQSSISIEVIL